MVMDRLIPIQKFEAVVLRVLACNLNVLACCLLAACYHVPYMPTVFSARPVQSSSEVLSLGWGGLGVGLACLSQDSHALCIEGGRQDCMHYSASLFLHFHFPLFPAGIIKHGRIYHLSQRLISTLQV